MKERILSISGKPGLYTLVSQGKNMLIVEDVASHKRMPAYARDKVMSLGDIAIYTTGEDLPLFDVFEAIKEKTGGQTVDVKAFESPEKMRAYFAEIVPDFDAERVYNTDIKKVFQWYNLLISNGISDFKNEEIAEDKAAEAADAGTATAAETFEAEKKAEEK